MRTAETRLSDELERWLEHADDRTVGGLLGRFGTKSFALLFVVLLAPSALPAPTGGVTNALEIVAIVVAVQLVIGRECIWLPDRWRRIGLAGERRERFVARLLAVLRFLERLSRPRLTVLFGRRASDVGFGLLVILFTAGAFVAPPFSGLDTLPALAVVLVSLGVLLEDALLVAAGLLAGAAGLALEVLLGKAALSALDDLL